MLELIFWDSMQISKQIFFYCFSDLRKVTHKCQFKLWEQNNLQQPNLESRTAVGQQLCPALPKCHD